MARSDLPEAFRDVDTLVLDMDGVVTSEESYFDAAGLTIRELFESPLYLGLSPPDYTSIPEVFYRRMAAGARHEWRKYLPSDLIIRCKSRGISTNWDLAYLVAVLYLAPLFIRSLHSLTSSEKPVDNNEDTRDWESAEGLAVRSEKLMGEKEVEEGLGKLAKVYRQAAARGDWSSALRIADFMVWGEWLRSRSVKIAPHKGIDLQLFDDFHPQTRGLDLLSSAHESVHEIGAEFGGLFGRNTALWGDMREVFQEWYLGEELYARESGRPVRAWPKPGLIHKEDPLLGMERTQMVLSSLRESGLRLGIATGRPRVEIVSPLRRWKLDRFFEATRIATHDELEKAQRVLRKYRIDESLSKPHPFVFLRSIHPEETDLNLYKGRYDSHQHRRFAVVGDAVADIWAGKKIGCPTVAVLSGVAGVLGRRHLEESKPDLVVKSLEELTELFR